MFTDTASLNKFITSPSSAYPTQILITFTSNCHSTHYLGPSYLPQLLYHGVLQNSHQIYQKPHHNTSRDNHCNCTINLLFHRIKIIRFTDCVRFTFILLNQNYCTSYIHYEFSPTWLALPSMLLGPLSRQVLILIYVERMINTPTFSHYIWLYIPHTPKWFPNWFPFHVRSMLHACFSTLVCTPLRQLLILFKSFSALIRSFFVSTRTIFHDLQGTTLSFQAQSFSFPTPIPKPPAICRVRRWRIFKIY